MGKVYFTGTSSLVPRHALAAPGSGPKSTAVPPSTRAETTSASSVSRISSSPPWETSPAERAALPSLWAVSPRVFTRLSGYPDLVLEASAVVPPFQRDFFDLMRGIFPDLLDWDRYFASQYPTLYRQLLGSDFPSFVEKVLSRFLQEWQLTRFLFDLPKGQSADSRENVRKFLKKWGPYFPVLAAIQKFEAAPRDWAEATLADMTQIQRRTFDCWRMADPKQPFAKIFQVPGVNYRGFLDFLVRAMGWKQADLAISWKTTISPRIPELTLELLMRLDALTSEERKQLCLCLTEVDQSLLQALRTSKRSWERARLQAWMGQASLEQSIARIQARLDDFPRILNFTSENIVRFQGSLSEGERKLLEAYVLNPNPPSLERLKRQLGLPYLAVPVIARIVKEKLERFLGDESEYWSRLKNDGFK